MKTNRPEVYQSSYSMISNTTSLVGSSYPRILCELRLHHSLLVKIAQPDDQGVKAGTNTANSWEFDVSMANALSAIKIVIKSLDS
jgi:hypothetical protein